jgi:hypothetical protein
MGLIANTSELKAINETKRMIRLRVAYEMVERRRIGLDYLVERTKAKLIPASLIGSIRLLKKDQNVLHCR